MLGLGLALGGCLEKQLAPIAPCTVSGVSRKVNVTNVDKIDLVMVVDNSGSMAQEQEKMRQQLPRLVAVLASGDNEAGQAAGTAGLGVQDFPPVKDLRIGVLNTNLGAGGFGGTECEGRGSDGLLLRTTGDPAPVGCGANGYGAGQAFVSYEHETATESPNQFADKVACVALTGAKGCGFEQQLESPLKALTPPTSNLVFAGGVKGNGDVNNFVREDSLLVIMMFTDEEDCSAADTEVFNTRSTTLVPPNDAIDAPDSAVNVRCQRFGNKLHSVDRYVNGFMDLRRDQPGLLVFAAVTGIPESLDNATLDTILADPAMAPNDQYAEELDLKKQVQLKPSCGVGSPDGTATPPRRIVKVAKGLQELGAAVTVKSICAPDYRGALNDIITKIADALRGACLPRRLIPDAQGKVNCDVLEAEPVGVRCDDAKIPGRVFVRTDDEGRDVCRVSQLTALAASESSTDGAGWYYEYDDSNGATATDLTQRCGASSQRVRFPQGAEPLTGAKLSLECLESTHGVAPDALDVGAGCASAGAGTTCAAGGKLGDKDCPSYALVCDPASLVWRQSCTVDSDCPAAFACDDTRTDSGGAAAPPICVNPTCE